MGEQGLRFPSGGPGRALPPGSPWGFPCLIPCLHHSSCGQPPGWVSRTASLLPLLPMLCLPLEAWLGHGSCLSPRASLSTTGSETGAAWCVPGESAPQGPLPVLCARSGQDLLPDWNLRSPVSCRWVQEFLNEENRGLDVLLEYLAFAQCSVT